jgi:hypothetical protein
LLVVVEVVEVEVVEEVEQVVLELVDVYKFVEQHHIQYSWVGGGAGRNCTYNCTMVFKEHLQYFQQLHQQVVEEEVDWLCSCGFPGGSGGGGNFWLSWPWSTINRWNR